jgi:hypothetical protein
MFQTCFWSLSCHYSLCLLLARYQLVLAIDRITSLHAETMSPGFLRAGRQFCQILLNSDFSVTHGHGGHAVPVSCSGGTAGITYSLELCTLAIVI